MRLLKIGIRQQLLGLVLTVALLSLMILAIITGVYFSENYKSVRAEKLSVIAQLKASQVEQSLNNYYYQVYWLTQRETIQNSLLSYRAGNTSSTNFYDAEDTIDQFLSSSNIFSNVWLYDSRFHQVVNSSDNTMGKSLPNNVLSQVLPLSYNTSLPHSIETVGLLSGPLSNSSSYVMSMTLPIFATASIIYSKSDLVGYLTTVMSADSLIDITNDTTALKDATVEILATDDATVTVNSTYYYALPSANSTNITNTITYPLKDNFIASQSLRFNKTGSTTSTSMEGREKIAAGYCPINFKMVKWAAVLSQPKSKFSEPSNQLAKITVGVCIGTAALMAILAFPLAHWAVQPILRLQQATETIAAGRGLQKGMEKRRQSPYDNNNNNNNNSNGGNSGLTSSRGSFNSARSPPPQNQHQHNPSMGTDENVSLSSGVAGFASGRTTYISGARVPYYTRFFQDELSKLTETFNAMTDELDRQYSHLEDRVKARTKQLEAAKIQAEAANEAKTVFIANISHELRTPLNGILGMTAIAMAEDEPNKIQQSLKLIFRSGELLLHILTELLTFSKNSLKRSKLEHSDFGVIDVALQIKSIFGKLAKDQNVNLSISLKPNHIRKMILYGDSNRIIQVVMNLVSNSLKFTPVEGKVSVTIRNIGEYDEEKSALENFEHVYIKPNTEQVNNHHHHHHHSQSPKKLDEKHIDGNGNVVDTSQSSNDTTTTSEEDIDDDSDKKSILTVSTTSYDDQVFQTQFKSNQHSKDGFIKSKDLSVEKTWVFEFEVEDTGPGIDTKLQETVFEPFVQGDQTLSRQYGGTGLGLSICRQLATMMKGVMELKSTVGVGSKFIFRVPLVQRKELVIDETDVNLYEDEFNANSKKNRKVKIVEPTESSDGSDNGDTPTTNVSSTSGSLGNTKVRTPTSNNYNDGFEYFDRPILQSTGTAKTTSVYSVGSNPSNITNSATTATNKNLKILVAEDNIVNQEVIKRMLTLEGFNDVELAVDGEQAVDFVKSKKTASNSPGDATPSLSLSGSQDYYDIIFMDVQMPKVDGLMATKTIRNELKFTNPIVALTAFADESNVRECLDAGMTGFLSKPIRRLQLRQILTEFCPVVLKEMVATPASDAEFKHNSSKNSSPKSTNHPNETTDGQQTIDE